MVALSAVSVRISSRISALPYGALLVFDSESPETDSKTSQIEKIVRGRIPLQLVSDGTGAGDRQWIVSGGNWWEGRGAIDRGNSGMAKRSGSRRKCSLVNIFVSVTLRID